MTLATIPGKRIATQTPASGAINAVLDAIYAAGQSSTYFDSSARTPGSGVAHNPSRYQNAGTTEAVYATFPTGALTQKWLIAGNAAGTSATMASPDTQAASRLLYQVAKNCGAYNAWTNAAPFTSGQAFGFWRSVSCGSVTIAKVHVWETAETWTVVLEDNAGAYYYLEVGMFLDPLTISASSAESDGRLVGQRGTGATAISATWATAAAAANALLQHSTTDGQAHQGVFQPGSSTIWPLNRHNAPDVSDTSALLNSDGEFVRFRPMYRRNAAPSNNRFVGIDRTIAHFRDAKCMQEHKTGGGTLILTVVGASATSDGDSAGITA